MEVMPHIFTLHLCMEDNDAVMFPDFMRKLPIRTAFELTSSMSFLLENPDSETTIIPLGTCGMSCFVMLRMTSIFSDEMSLLFMPIIFAPQETAFCNSSFV